MVPKPLDSALLQAVLLSLTLSLAWAAGIGHPLRDEVPGWRFDVLPPVNGTSNVIFDSVANLLQQWGNTHYRNGKPCQQLALHACIQLLPM